MKKQIVALTAFAGLLFGAATSASASEDTYTIKSGDTLWSISQKYNLTVQDLKSWNGLSSDLIFPNQKLSVEGAAAAPSAPAQPTKTESSSYTVKSGDTLYRIAVNHGVSVADLKGWNGLSSDLIFPNQKLAVQGGSYTTPASNPTPPAQTSPEAVKTFQVEATAYTAYCTGCSGITATGINLRANPHLKVIAVDPRVIPLGSRVWVEGYGEAIAGDTGGAIKGNKIDVFIPNQQQALNWGRKTVTIKILK
ncbi:3D (Asp-Asp-Asp) domain-containing protein [Chryseomicrobium aureum]|uniref:LysM peptidoglycan-binding and 3D domain-containing protein n=1 Tax=Chryseomicrobium aureum TaxID=1441723 RepID=UPI00195746DA|nr:3D domain-containing protein [Chryseomicrobium aureum]MBM7706121.1 3D (Asp-Asp-Asp) domain-containing protein [Chryseomicrobium aureum]